MTSGTHPGGKPEPWGTRSCEPNRSIRTASLGTRPGESVPTGDSRLTKRYRTNQHMDRHPKSEKKFRFRYHLELRDLHPDVQPPLRFLDVTACSERPATILGVFPHTHIPAGSQVVLRYEIADDD